MRVKLDSQIIVTALDDKPIEPLDLLELEVHLNSNRPVTIGEHKYGLRFHFTLTSMEEGT